MSPPIDPLPPTIMFTIYKNPLDYPGRYVVRRFTIGAARVTGDPSPVIVTTSLTEARKAIPRGLVRSPRDPLDEPQIVETWS